MPINRISWPLKVSLSPVLTTRSVQSALGLVNSGRKIFAFSSDSTSPTSTRGKMSLLPSSDLPAGVTGRFSGSSLPPLASHSSGEEPADSISKAPLPSDSLPPTDGLDRARAQTIVTTEAKITIADNISRSRLLAADCVQPLVACRRQTVGSGVCPEHGRRDPAGANCDVSNIQAFLSIC